ncbi:hypothetical protein EUTSA_v10002188mg [Eutrema salsugineum]|uniref:Uncharacterized protein n=1 Tax=Eutrema salsugineum TaxID=72664 RepID=V4M5K2_EUTSA|nr:hypothetical protein EUTSA_v10002188mg [Eutrema salsugineum]
MHLLLKIVLLFMVVSVVLIPYPGDLPLSIEISYDIVITKERESRFPISFWNWKLHRISPVFCCIYSDFVWIFLPFYRIINSDSIGFLLIRLLNFFCYIC